MSLLVRCQSARRCVRSVHTSSLLRHVHSEKCAHGAEANAEGQAEEKEPEKKKGFFGLELGQWFKSGDTQSRKKGVVLSQRIPENFTEDTMIPHLEGVICDSIQDFRPAELVRVARAYASIVQWPQSAIVERLCYFIKFRMAGFEAVDVVDVLGPMLKLQPYDSELFDMLAERVKLKIDDFNALNLLGVIRVYLRRERKDWKLLRILLPKLRELLLQYNAGELSEMLTSIAATHNKRESELLLILLPLIEKRYHEVSMMTHINNLWALTKMEIVHQGLLEQVAKDMSVPRMYKDLPAKFLARLIWIYARCGCLDLVPYLIEEARLNPDDFSAGDVARLAQAIPQETTLLKAAIENVRDQGELSRRDASLILLAGVNSGVLEKIPNEESPGLLDQLLQLFREEQNNFNREEVTRMVFVLHKAPEYSHLLVSLPKSWAEITKDVVENF